MRPVCCVRMKFKDCVVQENKSLLSCLPSFALYPEELIPGMLVLVENITNVPNASKKYVGYDVRWQTNGLWPVSINIDQLCTKFFKDDFQAMNNL